MIKPLISALNGVLLGKSDTVELLVMALLADGHVLIEDVPGTGKTTTSGLSSYVLEKSGLKPSYVVGGFIPELDTNAHCQDGKFFSAELDESDRSFVYFHPEIAVVTNIDWDHRDHYMTFKSVTDAFAEFLSNVKENGCAILYSDDPGVKILLKDYKST